MSLFKKIFGIGSGKKNHQGDSRKEQLNKDKDKNETVVPVLNLSEADQLVRCDCINWNETYQTQFIEKTLPERVGERLTPLLLDEEFKENPFCAPIDSCILFAMIAELEPGRIMEVGSGYTTDVMRHAKEVYMLPGELISIDPSPRKDIEEMVDAFLESPLQEVPASDFEILMPGEVVFFDTTHIDKVGGEVVYLFEEIMPVLKPGIIVGFHQIRIPRNYTESELKQGFSEQKLLLDFLEKTPHEVLFAGGWWKENQPGKVSAHLPLDDKAQESVQFWFRILAD